MTARCHVVVLMLVSSVALPAAGCGDAARSRGPAQPPAPRLAQQSPVSAAMPPATPAEYRVPIRRYRRHVARELTRMSADVARLRRALAAGDAGAARSAWRSANVRYQSIGAAYGAFGALDAAIDGSPGGLPDGIRDRRFTGLHRVELALFRRRSTAQARAPAAALAGAVARLRSRLPRLRIAPLDYALRAHEILEDTLTRQLTGRASPWSGDGYAGAAANVRGTRLVLATLAPMIDARSRAVREGAQRSLGRLVAALGALRRRHHGYPRLGATTVRERERIAALTAAAAESLAGVPELIDPRPPRPVRSPFGKGPS